MNEKELQLTQCMEQLGISLNKTQTDQFLQYYKLLSEWNQKINLTAITEFDQVVLKHFTDSVSLCRAVVPQPGEKLIDIGTGAGFPGIPLKIVFPELQVTLLDALKKRVDFLNLVIDRLALSSPSAAVEAFHGRAEEYAHDDDFRGKYDYAVSRAVSNISTIAEYGVPFLKENGCFIAYKGGDLEKELQQYGTGIEKTGAVLQKTVPFSLQNHAETIERTLVVLQKTAETPQQYPRRAGIPEKRPLK